MSEKYKHPSMMLFGKVIHSGSKTNDDFVIASRFVPSSAARDDFDDDCESTNSGHSLHCSKQDKTTGNEEATTEEEMDTEQQEELSSNSVLENPKTPATPSTDTENPKTHSKDEVCLSQDLPKRDQDQSDQESSNSDSQDQITLKKPDTILPCPRCSSMDTKFCYFNNYNVNQPRYFCKKCQRYWTAGGSMRNVPVGAGRRKSKNSAAYQHRHLVIPGAYDGITPHAMRSDGAVLAFGMDSPLPNPSKESQTFLTNVFFRSEHENKSSVLLSNPNSVSMEKGRNCNGVMTESSQPVLCLPYSWNPIPWQTGFPVSFSSAALPQRSGSVPAEPCNLQWLSTPSLNSDQSSTTSSPDNSTTLGKHSREGRILTSSNTDNNESSKEKEFEISSVVMPKKLRIDDPLDVSKSSIWTTLGIKNNNQNVSSSIGRVAYFGGLQQAKFVDNYERNDIIYGIEASSMVLQANPAAFLRSLAFHEVAQ